MSDADYEAEKDAFALDPEEQLFFDVLLRHDLEDRFTSGDPEATALLEWRLGLSSEPQSSEDDCMSADAFEQFVSKLPMG